VRVTDAWALLGIAPTEDARAVKRAYGRLLKEINVDADPAAFIELRAARDLVMSWGAEIPPWEQEGEADWQDDGAWADEADEPLDEVPGTGALLPFTPPWRDPARDQYFAPPPGREGPLQAACDALADLLYRAEPPDPARVAAAGAALLEACEDAPVDEVAGIESWLLSALAASIPRSDPLIGPAVARFGWDGAVRSRDFMFNVDLDALLERREARMLFDRCRAYGEPGQVRALNELMRPGRSRLGLFELGLQRDVRAFLDKVLTAHPMIEHDLDPGAVAWWRGRFGGRHLPDHFWLLLLLFVPLPLTIPLFSAGPWQRNAIDALGLCYAAAVGLSLIGILLVTELRFRVSARRRDAYYPPHSWRAAAAWIAAAALLLPAAALAPGGILPAIVLGLAALAAAVGGLLNTAPPTQYADAERQMGPAGFPGAVTIGGAAVLVAVPAETAVNLAAPMLALCFLAYRGHETAALTIAAQPVDRARGIFAAAGLLLVAAMVSVFAFAPQLPPPVLVVIIPLVLAAQHLATAAIFLNAGAIEWCVRAVAIIFHVAAGQFIFMTWTASVLASLFLYVLGYGLVRAVLAWRNAESGAEARPEF
jgi:hypothetical protein